MARPDSGAEHLGTATIGKEVEADWVLADDAGAFHYIHVAVAQPEPRPLQPPRFCALFVPGMPQQQFGNARMTDPLPTALVRRCWSIGLPTVRFDYAGSGLSRGAMPDVGDHRTLQVNASLVLQRVLRDHGENVVVIAYSAGNASVLPELVAAHANARVAAYVNISMGTRAPALTTPNLSADEALALLKASEVPLPEETLGLFDVIDVPSLYIVADADRLTPKADVEQILARESRADRFRPRWTLQVLPGTHEFRGAEDLPAEAVKHFLENTLMREEEAKEAPRLSAYAASKLVVVLSRDSCCPAQFRDMPVLPAAYLPNQFGKLRRVPMVDTYPNIVGTLQGDGSRTIKVHLEDGVVEELYVDGANGPMAHKPPFSSQIGWYRPTGGSGNEGLKSWKNMGITERTVIAVSIAKNQRRQRESSTS